MTYYPIVCLCLALDIHIFTFVAYLLYHYVCNVLADRELAVIDY